MAYVRKDADFGFFKETYKYTSNRIGRRQTAKAMYIGKTPLNQLRYQDKKAERMIRWKLVMNFTGDDIFVTLTYPPRTRKSSEEARHDIALFISRMRRIYKKKGLVFKYIYTSGRSKRGAIHFHIVMSYIDTKLITHAWWNIAGTFELACPRVDIRHLDEGRYDSTKYRKLAAYLVKNSCETFYSPDPIHKKRYCQSLNLEMPSITVQIVSANEWKKQPAAQKGYYIDKNNFFDGWAWAPENTCYIGCRCQQYTQVRLDMRGYTPPKRRRNKSPDVPELLGIEDERFFNALF